MVATRGRLEEIPPVAEIDEFASPAKGTEQFDHLRLPGGKIVTQCRFGLVPAVAGIEEFASPATGTERFDHLRLPGGKVEAEVDGSRFRCR